MDYAKLGRKLKSKYPGRYGDIGDYDVGRGWAEVNSTIPADLLEDDPPPNPLPILEASSPTKSRLKSEKTNDRPFFSVKTRAQHKRDQAEYIQADSDRT